MHQGSALRPPRSLAWWLVVVALLAVVAVLVFGLPTPSMRPLRYVVPPFGTSAGPPGVAAPDLPFCKVPR